MISKPLFNSTTQLAKNVASELEYHTKKIVFAESCTAGLSAALLAQFSGISKWLCGSMVTYQVSTKIEWLNINAALIEDHSAVSPQVTAEMAKSVLRMTPAADFSIAITGHLELDVTCEGALAFVASGFRVDDQIFNTIPVRYVLQSDSRCNRQWEAARASLNTAMQHLCFPPSEKNETSVEEAKLFVEPTYTHWDR